MTANNDVKPKVLTLGKGLRAHLNRLIEMFEAARAAGVKAPEEARALERKVEKGLMKPEYVDTDAGGHFRLERAEDARQYEPQAAKPLEYWQQ